MVNKGFRFIGSHKKWLKQEGEIVGCSWASQGCQGLLAFVWVLTLLLASLSLPASASQGSNALGSFDLMTSLGPCITFCYNKLPQTKGLKTTETSSLPVQEARCLKSEHQQGWLVLEVVKENPFRASPSFWWRLGFP